MLKENAVDRMNSGAREIHFRRGELHIFGLCILLLMSFADEFCDNRYSG